MEVDTFSLESAALRFGNEGQHAAVVPLGDEGELNSKFPHFQEQMVGVTVELEDVSWTIDEAFIGYNHGNSRLGDDQVLLEIATSSGRPPTRAGGISGTLAVRRMT